MLILAKWNLLSVNVQMLQSVVSVTWILTNVSHQFSRVLLADVKVCVITILIMIMDVATCFIS